MDLRFPKRFVLNVLTSSVLVGIPGKHLKIDLTIVCETKNVSRSDVCWLANAVRKNDCKKINKNSKLSNSTARSKSRRDPRMVTTFGRKKKSFYLSC